MCYESTAVPPFFGPAPMSATGTRITLTSADNADFGAYLTTPERPDPTGVVILPDLNGMSAFYEQLALRLAEHGHPALGFDYFGRSAGIDYQARPADFSPFGNLRRDRLQSDLVSAIERLRAAGCAEVVALGFCLGGRLAFLASTPRFGLAGAIGLYGAPGIAGPYGPGPTQHAADLDAPILALFGGADDGIPPGEVTAFGQALTAANVPHDIVTYPDAPHGYFEVDQHVHAHACADSWRRILAFLRQRPATPR